MSQSSKKYWVGIQDQRSVQDPEKTNSGSDPRSRTRRLRTPDPYPQHWKRETPNKNLVPDLIPLLVLILLGVLLSPLEGLDPLGLARELALDGLPGAQRPVLGLSLALLEHGLRHGGQLLVRHCYT